MCVKTRSAVLCVWILIVFPLSVCVQAQDVTLAWDPNSEPDLAGYNLYRSTTSGSGYVKVNTSLVPAGGSPSFTDTADKTGLSAAYYVVTAIDDSGLESESSNQVQVAFGTSEGSGGGGGGLVNLPPAAIAGPDLTAYKNELVTLSGSGSDPEGGTVTYQWSQAEGPEIALSDTSSPTPTFPAPGFLEDTLVLFSLTVTDGLGAVSTDDVSVTILKNRPPQVDAGGNRTVASGSTVTLETGATDPDGDPLIFNWRQVSGTPVTLLGAQQADPSVQIPKVDADTEVVLAVTAHDGNVEVEALLTLQVVIPMVIAPVNTALGAGLSENIWVGVAVVNLGPNQNPILVTSKARDGRMGTQREFEVPLRPFGQQAFLVREVVGPEEDSAVLVAEGRQGTVQGFFMVGHDDLRLLDGIGGELKKSETLYMPIATQDVGIDTVLFVYNPHSAATGMTLQVFSQSGVLVAETFQQLAPEGTLLGTLGEIFTGFQGSVEGYVKITADQPVQGFELVFEQDDNVSSASAQTGAVVNQLLAPHFYVDSQNGSSVIRLLNLEPIAIRVTVEAFDDSGNPMGTASEVDVGANELLIADVRTLLNLNPQGVPGGIIDGYLELEVGTMQFGSKARVLGTLTFGGNLGEYRSTLPLLSAGERETLLLHVAQSQELQIFNGVAILNPRGGQAAQISVTAYDLEGSLNGQAQVTLQPGERVVGLLNEPILFGPTFSQVKGHIRISSSEPVVVFAVFGGFDLRYMSAVEGQRPLE